MGLVLAGGGALGAWQAGALDALVRAGLEFDKVIGFSAGALTGATYCFGWDPHPLDLWRDIDRLKILRFAPKFAPLSLFSDAPIWESVAYIANDEAAKAALKRELIVMSLCVNDGMPVYSRFTPRGKGGWDGQMTTRIAASCSIPLIFPPVLIHEQGRTRTYIDGGVPGREWFRCDALAGCADVIVLEMIRPEEGGRSSRLPWKYHEVKGRSIVRRQVDSGIDSLLKLPKPPRVYRLYPSRILDFMMLSFHNRHCAPAVDLGISDARGFLEKPTGWISGPSLAV